MSSSQNFTKVQFLGQIGLWPETWASILSSWQSSMKQLSPARHAEWTEYSPLFVDMVGVPPPSGSGDDVTLPNLRSVTVIYCGGYWHAETGGNTWQKKGLASSIHSRGPWYSEAVYAISRRGFNPGCGDDVVRVRLRLWLSRLEVVISYALILAMVIFIILVT